MADRDKPAKIRAAGALLWRPAEQGPEVALVHRPRYGDWSFPKGKALPGEHVLITAVREVREETGVRITLGRRLNSATDVLVAWAAADAVPAPRPTLVIHPRCSAMWWSVPRLRVGRRLNTAHYLSDGKPKQVEYWAARPAAADGPGDPAGPAPFAPNEEVDRLAWLPLPAAGDRLSYPHDKEVLGEFASAPAVTTPIILVRHASARNKKVWRDAGHPDDLTRPLTPLGHVQAKLLGQILSCFGPGRVISSPAERCLATVEPYAADSSWNYHYLGRFPVATPGWTTVQWTIPSSWSGIDDIGLQIDNGGGWTGTLWLDAVAWG